MRLADADNVRAKVMADILDMAGHCSRIRDWRLARVDGARGRLVQQIREVIMLVSGTVRVRARNRIRRYGIAAIVEQGLAHVAAADARVRRLLGMDVDDRI